MTTDPPDRSATDLVLPLWRSLVVFRIATWLFACVAAYLRRDDIARPWGAVVLLAVMAAWTVVVSLGYSRPWGRYNTRFAVLDLVVTIACMAGTLLAQPLERIHGGATILTSVWAAGPVLALAVARGRDGGVLGAVVLSAALLGLRGRFTHVELNNIQLLVVAGLVVGYAATTTRRASARLRDAIAAESAATERERLGRSIHDGVLQVLAQVQRRGRTIGGEALELAELAAEQEVALRTLMTSRPASTHDSGDTDLCSALALLATPQVEVVVPAHAVPLPAGTVAELAAVVTEALNNVARHAGPGAHAWVVVEDLGTQVLVSVRDDGAGTTPERMAAATAAGRLGVSQSIRGRIRDLGGTVELRTAPGEGTEWELTVSRGRRA